MAPAGRADAREPHDEHHHLYHHQHYHSGFSLGLLAMIASAFFFSVMALLVKFLPEYGPFELVFWRSLFMSLISTPALVARGINPAGKPGTRGLLLWRGVAGFGFMGGYYYSIKLLTLSDAVVITHTSPVITAIAAAVVLGETWEAIDAAGCLLCLVGVVMVSKPDFIMRFFGAEAEPLPFNGLMGAVAAALLSSVVYILLRIGKDLNPIVSTNYFAITGVLVSPAFSYLFGERWVTPSGVCDWLLLLLLALLSIVGQALMNIGLSLESAGKATAMYYAQVVFAYLFQTCLLHEQTDMFSIIGACLISSWGVFALVKDAQHRRLAMEHYREKLLSPRHSEVPDSPRSVDLNVAEAIFEGPPHYESDQEEMDMQRARSISM